MNEVINNEEIDSFLDDFDKKTEARIKILSLEEMLSQLPGTMFGDSDYCPLKHHFADNIYMREMLIPKGTIIIGKIHKYSHPSFLLKGKISVFTESGGIEHLEAPIAMISPPGTKRVGFAHEDTIWITVHVTDKLNLDEIEEEVIAKSYEDFLKMANNKTINRLEAINV